MSAKCDHCDEPASVHFVADGSKQEIHLCRRCAEKNHIVSTAPAPLVPVAVQQLVVATVAGLASELAHVECPDCGLAFMQFRRQGRLGCPNDYATFRQGLLPLVNRVHSATQHTGKRPRFRCVTAEAFREVRQLRRQLRIAVEAEDFADAKRLRDSIRAKEAEYGC
jgi:protein arginine kinase activator